LTIKCGNPDRQTKKKTKRKSGRKSDRQSKRTTEGIHKPGEKLRTEGTQVEKKEKNRELREPRLKKVIKMI